MFKRLKTRPLHLLVGGEKCEGVAEAFSVLKNDLDQNTNLFSVSVNFDSMAKEKKTVEKKKKEVVSNSVTQAIDGSNIIISQNGEPRLRIPRNSCKTFTFDDYNVTIVRFKIRSIEKWAVFSNNKFFLRTSPLIAAQSVTKVKTKQKAILSQIMKRD